MSKQLLNKITNKIVIFSNDFEKKLRDLNNRNCHDEIRVEIANQLGLPAFAICLSAVENCRADG